VAAVKFLNENAFATPTMLLRPEVLRRIEPTGASDPHPCARRLQVLNSLLTTQRFSRLVEQEAIDGAAAYRPSEFLGDLRKGIFGELYGNSVKIDAYRRNLQRAYLDLISTRLNGAQRANDDQRPMFRGELRTIAADAGAALARTTNRDTRLHLQDVRDQSPRSWIPSSSWPIQLPRPPPSSRSAAPATFSAGRTTQSKNDASARLVGSHPNLRAWGQGISTKQVYLPPDLAAPAQGGSDRRRRLCAPGGIDRDNVVEAQ
jgi:hypothetical protein